MPSALCLGMLLISAADELVEPADAFEAALTALERQDGQIQSLSVEFVQIYDVRESVKGRINTQPRYLELRQGNKYRIENRSAGGDYITAFDGVKQTYFDSRGNSGRTSTRKLSEPYGYYNAVYGWKHSLAEELRSHAADANVQWVDTPDGPVLEVAWQVPRFLMEARVQLDGQHGWQPREIELRQSSPDNTFLDRRNGEVYRREFVEFKKLGEVVLPSEVRYTDDALFPNGPAVRMSQSVMLVKSLEINLAIPSDRFTVEFPSGARVHDDDGLSYTAGPRGVPERAWRALVWSLPNAIQNGSIWTKWQAWLAMLAAAAIAGGCWHWRRRIVAA